MMKPGVQKPHWNAAYSIKAVWIGSSSVAVGQALDRLDRAPSRKAREKEAARNGHAVDRTVQQPHRPCAQLTRAPWSAKSRCSTR